ncbi:MAG: Lrp/AsnC ligand binding domain-containing protein [Candidatus Bathyarchaeota archaeon]|nr:Lrp/AsnC ligand binding domain-containing protein [Candidatus Bathyarchaeota archaeon]MDH5687215.1 Lrp/AsnC ligand binding domain-containing protein [Candidatus Bathyarchaeota archaeon]
MVRAVILIRAPKTLTSSKVRGIEGVVDAFDVSGRFDAIALIEAKDLSTLKEAVLKIQRIKGVRRTETLVEVP